MTDSDPFRCRCAVPCTERATQEDMRCDDCRQENHLHWSADLCADVVLPMRPLTMCGPLQIHWRAR